MQVNRFFKHELKQPVGDDMKSNRSFTPNAGTCVVSMPTSTTAMMGML